MPLLNRITQFDTRLFLKCVNSPHHRSLTKTAFLISKTGDGYLHITLPLLLAAHTGEPGQQLLLHTLVAFIVWLPLYWVLKNSFQRRRPPEALPSFRSSITASDRFSFPSGHTAAAVMLAVMLYLHFGEGALPMMLWASAVGISRVVLGVHFPTDILAGATLGSSMATASYWLLF